LYIPLPEIAIFEQESKKRAPAAVPPLFGQGSNRPIDFSGKLININVTPKWTGNPNNFVAKCGEASPGVTMA